METGKIVSWLKSAGDDIRQGDNILVVESDKADMDVESFQAGTLAAIVVDEGQSAPVGSAIAFIADTTDDIATAKERAEQLRQSLQAASPASAPAPAAQPTPARAVAAGTASNGKSTTSPAPVSTAAAPPRPPSGGRVVASPLAKRLAQQLGVDVSRVQGSGPNGRVVSADIERAAKSGGGKTTALAATSTAAPPNVPLGEVVSFSTLQQAVIRTMNESLAVPTYRVGYTITTDALNTFYRQVKGKGVTMTALLVKAVALSLEQHPLVNARYTAAGIHYNADINISVAVAMEDGGLITPVLQQANRVDLYELSRQWQDLVDRARRKQLQPEEYSSGTFTLSNLGMFGVDRFDAILPPGQGGILAIGASQPTVVATPEGAIAVKSQMQVNVTCDHRIIYGAHAAAFLQSLGQLLENRVESLAL
jgi:pyruvate dehydrogenase E2 component (dihydrolipoamide acetyltransferase)